jgi:isopenicillin-N N-acyltransferase-like protein
MAGFHHRGLGIGINNLHSLDAHVGVVWPALVRKVLRAETADIGRDTILSANVGSGHHYLVADRTSAYGIETSGRLKKIVFDSKHGDTFIHTNHCLDAGVAAVSTVPVGSTSQARYDRLVADIKKRPIANARDAYDRLSSQEGFPQSICTNQATPENPHGPATCGAISIDLQRSVALCVGGFPHGVEPDVFSLEHL